MFLTVDHSLPLSELAARACARVAVAKKSKKQSLI